MSRVSIHNKEKVKFENSPFPGYTTGHYIKKCGLRFLHLDGCDEWVLGSWIFRPWIPLCGLVFSFFGWLLASNVVFPKFESAKSLIIIDFVLMFAFCLAFVATITEGPGYYPFYWALGKGPDEMDSTEETPLRGLGLTCAGFISNDAQLAWARSQPRPPRSIVAKSSRRIVIRPDHYCNWSETWIGKRNIKFFILYNVYAALFTGIISICATIVLTKAFLNGKWHWNMFIYECIFCAVVAGYFMLFTGLFAIASIVEMCQGVSNWERTNKLPIEKFDHGLKNNIEDVFGPTKEWYLYCIPWYSPFSRISNDELVANYPNYYVDLM